MISNLTEAARRAFVRADRLAEKAGSSNVKPEHLLLALLLEESRAAEVLDEFGLSLESLDPENRPSVELPDRTELPLIGETLSDLLQNVLFEAGERAGHSMEIGTDDLLWGLAKIKSPVAQLLNQHGLNAEKLAERLAEMGDVEGEPLDVDFQIEWNETRNAPEKESEAPAEPPPLTKGGRQETAANQIDTLRILDAAANRAREGLRVLEDYVRFTLDDAHLTGLLKQCRHNLAESLKSVKPEKLLRSRNTQQDVGTEISTPAETKRSSSTDVVQANFKRVQEAARTLEEFGKLISPAIGKTLEEIRYRLYTVEKAVLLTAKNRERLAGRNLYLLVTRELCKQSIEKIIRESIAAGVSIVQLREKSLPDRELVKLGKRVREWTRESGALFIMNDRPDLAVLTDADGVHVGQEELSVHEARRIVGPDRLVGFSTHNIEQARQAVLDGADYLGVGPVFPSQTKKFDDFAGLEFVKQAAAEITLPWYAIGGINTENIPQVLDAGATRIAVTGAICSADDPAEAALRLRKLSKRL